MKRFRFRLDALLDIKIRAEEEIKKELAKKNGELLKTRREIQEINGRLESFFSEEKKQRLRTLDLLALRFSISYSRQLQKDIVFRQKVMDGIMEDIEQLRIRFAKARKECRILEILKEKKLGRWKKEYRMEEQKFTDDISQKGYIRKLQHTADRSGSRSADV
jgi:flagellar protein FliJ